MIKKICTLIFLYTAIGAILLSFFTNNQFILSFLLGCFAMLFNVAGLAYFWYLIFNKKSIALAVFVIIFKYVVLGLILWGFTAYKNLVPLGFFVGLGALVFSVLAGIAHENLVKKKSVS